MFLAINGNHSCSVGLIDNLYVSSYLQSIGLPFYSILSDGYKNQSLRFEYTSYD
jgi:hypothetical protein